MRYVKITKRMLKDPETILRKAGAVHGKSAFPSYVYMNKNDYKQLEKNLTAYAKKLFGKSATERKIKFMVGMELLNLGPVVLDKGIEKGYILVNDEAIKESIKNEDNVS